MTTIARMGRGLLLALSLGLAAPAAATAQDDFAAPAEGEGGGGGKPIFGYLACGAGCIAIMFILCISARR